MYPEKDMIAVDVDHGAYVIGAFGSGIRNAANQIRNPNLYPNFLIILGQTGYFSLGCFLCDI
jgi:hypothetical protein